MPVDWQNERFRKPLLKETILIDGQPIKAAVSRDQTVTPDGRPGPIPSGSLIIWTDVFIRVKTVIIYEEAEYTITDRKNYAFKSWQYVCNGDLEDPGDIGG